VGEDRAVDPVRLEAIPLFASLPEPDRELIAGLTRPVEVAEGAEVATQNDFGYSFFAIEEGTADVRIDDESVGRLGPGDFFGEIALLCTGRRTAAVVSTSPMKLLSLFEQEFRQIESRIPTLARELRRAAGERLVAART
jgi:CRP-like cAMP-binding protein